MRNGKPPFGKTFEVYVMINDLLPLDNPRFLLRLNERICAIRSVNHTERMPK